jgi:hypothetical protein
MTQLAAGSVAEADVMHAAITAYAKPHVDTAAAAILQCAQDVQGIIAAVPTALAERVTMQEFVGLATRTAASLGLALPEEQAHAPTLGVARRLAIESINRAADTRCDAIAVVWARGADLPVLDSDRLTDAALMAGVAFAARVGRGETLEPHEASQLAGLLDMHAQQAGIRAAQRDHVREIDRLEDIEAVRAYPASAAWPE